MILLVLSDYNNMNQELQFNTLMLFWLKLYQRKTSLVVFLLKRRTSSVVFLANIISNGLILDIRNNIVAKKQLN